MCLTFWIWDNQDTSKMNGYIAGTICITQECALSFFNAMMGVSIPEQSVATRIDRGGAIFPTDQPATT